MGLDAPKIAEEKSSAPSVRLLLFTQSKNDRSPYGRILIFRGIRFYDIMGLFFLFNYPMGPVSLCLLRGLPNGLLKVAVCVLPVPLDSLREIYGLRYEIILFP